MHGFWIWLLAAQGANLHALYIATSDSEIVKWFALGQEAAQRALEFNTQSAEAHFESARSIGGQLSQQNLLGRVNSVSAMRGHLLQVLRLRPDYPEAKAALGVGTSRSRKLDLVGFMVPAPTRSDRFSRKRCASSRTLF